MYDSVALCAKREGASTLRISGTHHDAEGRRKSWCRADRRCLWPRGGDWPAVVMKHPRTIRSDVFQPVSDSGFTIQRINAARSLPRGGQTQQTWEEFFWRPRSRRRKEKVHGICVHDLSADGFVRTRLRHFPLLFLSLFISLFIRARSVPHPSRSPFF